MDFNPSPRGRDHQNSLKILLIDPAAMADENRLNDLICSIERTGANVRRLFPSVDIITVESDRNQTSQLHQLAAVTGIESQQPFN